jgi:DNA repair protein SbcC/Rad50
MVPSKLTLSNFTSYGEKSPTLDFSKFQLAAISGLNGAGKSSLLDSITWCLWGTSRAGDSADALVKLGQENMSVEFSFDLDGHNFTVKRARSKKGGGHTALEFWSTTHNLTEGTIKSTQQKIIDTLHLTYETFTNSAFLRQGNADEFTNKGPTDRKRILADILGLDHYDALEEKAKEKSKDAQTKLSLLEYQVLEIEAELQQKDERSRQLTLAEEEARITEDQVKEKEKKIKEIEEEKNKLDSALKLLEEKKSQVEAVKKELEDLNYQILLKVRDQKEYQNILDQKEAIEENCQKLQKLENDKKSLELKRSELIKIKDEWGALQQKIIGLEARRSQKIASLEVEIKKYQTENEQTQDQINHLKQHKDVCPTCGGIIDEQKNKQILEEDEKNLKTNNNKLSTLNQELTRCQAFELKEKNQSTDLEKIIHKLEEETKDWLNLNTQIRELEKYSELFIKLQQAETAVKSFNESIADLQKLSTSKQVQLDKSLKEIKGMEIFENNLRELRVSLQSEEYAKQEINLKAVELRSRVGEARQLLSRVEQMEKLFKEKQEEKTKLNNEKTVYDELGLAFGKKGIQAMIIEQAIPEIEDEANRLLDRLTEGRMKVALITQKETKTKIAGLDGTKDYGTVETLDIVISDEMGERPYEMYSGGETFRVNFAIRLAISKLLTHRAGAKLQFLVIDEGFGSQDAPGRARLVEVIDSIKNDFEKIVVVTHIEELKEEFPTRIEVIKASSGSTFEIVGA